MNIESFWEYDAVKLELAMWHEALRSIDEEIHESPVVTEFTDFESRQFFDDWLSAIWASQ